MTYVDGFIVPVKKDRLEEYKDIARLGREVWMGYGALSYFECVADDVSVGEVTSFPRAVKLEDDEVVVFSWITYPSRQARDEINAKVMADERMKGEMAKMPFDGKRLIFGGFEAFVEG